MNRKLRTWILSMAAPLFLALASSAGAAPTISKWEGLTPTIQGSTLDFQPLPGKEQVPSISLSPLKEAAVIGWLRPSVEATPYLLVSAHAPDASERSLFIFRADGKLKPQRVTFPGKLLDPKTREMVHESRAFFGRCLGDQQHDALVLYQRDRLDRKHKLQASIYVAEASPNLLTERLVERRLPSISSIQLRVRSRQCTEVSGRNRLFDSAFFQFRNRGADLPDDDEDDDKDKNDEKGDKDDEAVQKAAYETT
jgi:hypothetical protein